MSGEFGRKLWWSMKGRVGQEFVLVKEELCRKLMEDRRLSGRVTTIVLFF